MIPVRECALRLAKIEDARALVEFWNRFYSTSSKAKCFVPVDFVCKMLLKGVWEIWIVVTQSGEIVGSIMRRWMKNLQIPPAVLPRAGFIEYFCVHPSWRKKGVGRLLLANLHNTASPNGICPPHLFLWEGLHPTTPPFSTGLFYSKRGSARNTLESIKENLEKAWAICKRDCITAEGVPSDEVNLYQTSKGIVAIWNTFHRSMPDGARIGIVVGNAGEEAIEEVLEKGPYGVLLRTSSKTGWSMDSPYQWVAYNLHIPSLLHSFPCLPF